MAENRSTINTNKFFGNRIPDPWGNASIPKTSRTQTQTQENPLVSRNAILLTKISLTMEKISKQMVGMNKSLVQTSKLIVSSEKLRQDKEKDENRKNQVLLQQTQAGRSENTIEASWLQKKLMSPITNIANKAKGILSKLTNAFLILFGGWLTNQVLTGLQAWSDQNWSLLSKIRNNILGSLFGVTFLFRGVKWALSSTIKLIGGIAAGTAKIASGIISRPLGALLSAATGGRFGQRLANAAPFRRLPITGTRPIVPSSKLGNVRGLRGGGGLRGGLGTGISLGFDVFEQKWGDLALGLLSFLGPGKYVRGAAYLGYWGKKLWDMFRGNEIPDVPANAESLNIPSSGSNLEIVFNDEDFNKPLTPASPNTNFFGANQGREGFENQKWDFWDWIPDDWLNKGTDLSLGSSEPIGSISLDNIALDNNLSKENTNELISSSRIFGKNYDWSKLGTVDEQSFVAIPISIGSNQTASKRNSSGHVDTSSAAIPTISSSNLDNKRYSTFAYSQANLVGAVA